MVYSGIMTGIIICVLAYSCWMDIRQREIPIELYLLVILPMGIIALIMGIGPGVFEAISMAVIVGICLYHSCFVFSRRRRRPNYDGVLGYCAWDIRLFLS